MVGLDLCADQNMKTLKTAVFGTGFMGRVHLEAIRRNEFVDAVAIAGRTVEAAQRLGAGFSVPAFTADYREMFGESPSETLRTS